MKDNEFGDWLMLVICFVILGLAIYFLPGCATAPTLSITDADVDAKIAAIGSTVPKDPGADVYNETTGKYELTPAAHDRALRDGIIKRIQDEKIEVMNAYLVEHPPTTLKTRLKAFGWDAIIILVLEAVILGAVGFSQ